jgi:hypothetical protein
MECKCSLISARRVLSCLYFWPFALSAWLYGSGEKSEVRSAGLKRGYELYNYHLGWRGIGVGRIVDYRLFKSGNVEHRMCVCDFHYLDWGGFDCAKLTAICRVS